MADEYKQLENGGLLRLRDNACIPADPRNADYQRALAEIEAGATILPEDPEPDPEPTRDERLLAAVEQAKEIVSSGGFTETQAAKLSAVFDGLGAAITGGGS